MSSLGVFRLVKTNYPGRIRYKYTQLSKFNTTIVMAIISLWINVQKYYNLCKRLVSRNRDTLAIVAESCCLHVQLRYLMAFDPNSEFLGCFSLPWYVFFPLCVVNCCVWQVWALLPLITISCLWQNPMGTTHVGSNILKASQQGFFSIGVVGCAASRSDS